MTVITILSSIVLFSLIAQALATKLLKNGKNVCERNVPYSVTETFSTTMMVTEKTTECCEFKMVGMKITCHKRCTKSVTRTKTRVKTRIVAKLRNELFCCKGWTNRLPTGLESPECTAPVCTTPCNPGQCVNPNMCRFQYDSEAGFESQILKYDKCGGSIIDVSGKLSLFGTNKKSPLATQVCTWKINIPYYQKTKFRFTYFDFAPDTQCADSIVTISTTKMEYLYCSEKKPNLLQDIVFDEREFVIKAVKTNWQNGRGFELRFL